MKQIPALFLVAIFFLFSCSKENNDNASKTELLTGSPWYHMRSTSQVGGVTYEAPYSSFDICVKDDPYSFLADKRLNVNQGNLDCSGEADYNYMYQWDWKDNETTLAINMDIWRDWQIVKLTRDSLVIKSTDAVGVSTNFYAHSY